MAVDLVVVGLRFVFVLLIYAFLFQVVLVVVRDLPKGDGVTDWSDSNKASLVVVDAGSETMIPGQRFDLLPISSIGRSPANVIVIPDTFVSTEHALLSFRDGQWWIEDLGSTNGTYINRRLIAGPTPVEYGDIIEIGKTRMKLVKQTSRS